MALQFVNPFSLLKAGTYIKNAKQYITLKKQLQKADDNPDTEIVGVSGFVFMERTIKASDLSTPVVNGLTETVDSSSYPDRAIISLTNALGYNAYITNFIIDGQPIMRYKGAIVHDSLRRDDDIRRNGESLFELGNEYVIDATQATRLADYWYKNLGKKKHVYSVSIPGFAPWYSPGDWYTLSLGSAGTNEYISSTVECYDVQCSRTAGDIGSTTLMLREVEENWTKTTLYAARAVTGGSPKRRSQQSNTLIVAASTFDGTYDYKCDGTADDVEIQAAIDYAYYTWGGGEVRLTEGSYYAASTITIRNNINLIGAGEITKIKPSAVGIGNILSVDGLTAFALNDFSINGDSESITLTADTSAIYTSALTMVSGVIKNIKIENFSITKATSLSFVAFGYVRNLYGCVVKTCNLTATGSPSAATGYGFTECYDLVSCSCDSIICADATITSPNAIGFNICENIYGGYSNNNSATKGATKYGYGYTGCKNITNVYATGNDATGIIGCRSVQQCRSTANGTNYSSSYADAGTSNACADTAAGGYNS
jgi:hypothetical protein